MFTLFRKHRSLFTLTIITSLIFAAIGVSSAFVLEQILNSVTNGDWGLFRTMIAVVAGYAALVAVVGTLDAMLRKKLVACTVESMRQDLYQGIMGQDTEHYTATNTADYISTLTNDVKMVEDAALTPFLQSVQYLFMFLFTAAALLYYSPLIAGVMLLCLIIMYTLPAALGKPIAKRQDVLSKSLSTLTTGLKDQFSGYDVIRSFRLGERSKQAFAEQNHGAAQKRYGVDKLLATSEGLSQVLGMGTQLVVMLVSAYMALQGHITAGVLLALLSLSGSFVQPVAVIMQTIPAIQGVRPILERIQAFSKKQPSAFTGTKRPEFKEAIRFEDVSFNYTEEQPVLQNLSLTLEKNKKYALVGGSGSGKSTMAKLLCASYGSYTGKINLDGDELRELDTDALLAEMSVIHQSVYMFDETIRRNIDLHRNYSSDEWERALKVSGVDKFLPQMAEGLDTPVGENGAALSGGQRQRVAVARALIERKSTLILDEGTSAVDAQTAYDIETGLLAEKDLTMLTITHNLSPELLRRYDSILYMEDGHIKETGSYESLIEMNGAFASFAKVKEMEVKGNEHCIKPAV